MKFESGTLDGGFILVAQAARAKVKLFGFAANHDGGRMDIGNPAPVGMSFGVADVRTVNRDFTANIALQFSKSPLVSRYEILQNLPIIQVTQRF